MNRWTTRVASVTSVRFSPGLAAPRSKPRPARLRPPRRRNARRRQGTTAPITRTATPTSRL